MARRLIDKVNQRAPGAHVTITGEEHIVGEDENNYVYLKEVPLFEYPSSVIITGFTEVFATPEAGEFRVVYTGVGAGRIQFHDDDDGEAVSVSYKGRGSNVQANDINRIHAEITSGRAGGGTTNVTHPDIGMVGDGETDNSPFVDNLVTGTNVFPPGTFNFDSSCTFTEAIETEDAAIIAPASGVVITFDAPTKLSPGSLSVERGGSFRFGSGASRQIFAREFGLLPGRDDSYATENTTNFNAFMAALKASASLTSDPDGPMGVVDPGDYYINDTIDGTFSSNAQKRRVQLFMRGARIIAIGGDSGLKDKIVFDLSGWQESELDGLRLETQSGTLPDDLPACGVFQSRFLAPSGTAITAARNSIQNFRIDGSFKVACLINWSSETCVYFNGKLYNNYVDGKWAMVAQATDYVGVRSTFVDNPLEGTKQSGSTIWASNLRLRAPCSAPDGESGLILLAGSNSMSFNNCFGATLNNVGAHAVVMVRSPFPAGIPTSIRFDGFVLDDTWDQIVRIDGKSRDISLVNLTGRVRRARVYLTPETRVTGLKIDVARLLNPPITELPFEADTTTDVLTLEGHGLQDDDVVTVRATSDTGSLPGGLSADTNYYVINTVYDDEDAGTTASIQLAASEGGPALDITSVGADWAVVPSFTPLALDASEADTIVEDCVLRDTLGVHCSGIFQGDVIVPSTVDVTFDNESVVHASVHNLDTGARLSFGASTTYTDATGNEGRINGSALRLLDTDGNDLEVTGNQISRNGVVIAPHDHLHEGWLEESLAAADTSYAVIDRFGKSGLAPIKFAEKTEIRLLQVQTDAPVTAGGYSIQLQKDTLGDGTFADVGDDLEVTSGRDGSIGLSIPVEARDQIRARIKSIAGLTPDPLTNIRMSLMTRSASEWAPSDLPNLLVWGAADQLGLANDDPVSTFTGLAGTPSLTASGTARPLFKTNIVGTLPGVLFDGVNDVIFVTGEAFADSLSGINEPFTAYLVMKMTSVGGSHCPLSLSEAVSGGAFSRFTTNSQSKWAMARKDDDGVSTTWAAGTADTDIHILTHTFYGTSGSLSVDDTIVLDSKPIDLGIVTFDTLSIGAQVFNSTSTPAPMYAFEYLLFGGAHSDLTQARVRDYLSRWTA